ncbi:MAG TPA: tetratricopeptide repeat protein, partial [Xanthomonadaceae bacterium]|nr:tetratricopeptide repeat protein [Xanthomonadaceae bacterium]
QGDVALATDMFKQAASMSSSGEASLNLAKVHFNAGRYADAKVAAQAALAKGGLKNPEDARKLIAPQPKAKAK